MPTLNELGKKVKAKYAGQYDDLTDLELGRRVRAKYPNDYADFSGADSTRVTVRPHERAFPKRSAGGGASFAPERPKTGYERATDLIPLVTGGIGGAVGGGVGATLGIPGGPAGIQAGRAAGSAAGADVLGAGGEALRQLVTEVPALVTGGVPAYEAAGGPQNPAEAFQRIADVGSEQAQLDLAGQALSGVAKGAGWVTMMAALRANPELAKTAIDFGIKFNKYGKDKLLTLLGRTGDSLRQVVAQADARGGGLHSNLLADRIEQQVNATLAKNSTEASDPVTKAAVERLKERFLQSSGPLLPLTKAQIFKKSAGDEAKGIFARAEKGAKVEIANDPVRQIWKHAENQVLSDALETAIGPAYSTINAIESKLIRLKNLIAPDAEKQAGVTAVGALRGAGAVGTTLGGAIGGEELGRRHVTPGGPLMGALGGALAGSPQGLSMLALLLSSPAVASLLKNTPRGIAGVMQGTE